MAARQYLPLAFLKVGRAAASAMLVGICHIGALYKKARTKAGNGNGVEGLLGLVSASIVEVGGRVVLALAPVHLDGAGMVGGMVMRSFSRLSSHRLASTVWWTADFVVLLIAKALSKFPNSSSHGTALLRTGLSISCSKEQGNTAQAPPRS